MATKNMSMGKPYKVLLAFALPIIFSVCFQQLYNIADSLIAGKLIGRDALAAVGAAYPITVIFLGIANGCANGSGVIIARIFGNSEYSKVRSCISTIILFMMGLAVVLTVVGYFVADPVLKLMSTPENIFADCSLYLKIYVYGLIFLFIYNTSSAIFQALGNSKVPMFMLIFSTVLNVILDVLLIKKFNLGVAGLAWGTFIAQGVASMVSFLVLIYNLTRMQKEDIKVSLFSPFLLKKCMTVAIPSTIQASTVSIGQLFVQSLVNGFGTAVVAGYGAGFKVNYIVISIFLATSNALATYISQNIGASKMERLKPGLKSAFVISGSIAIFFTILYLVFSKQIIGLFVDNSDDVEVINIGVNFLRIVSPFYLVVIIKITFDGFIRGAGDIFGYTTSTMTDLIVRVGLSYLFVYLFAERAGIFGGENVIWWTWPLGWIIGAIVACVFFVTARWKKTAKVKI